MQGNEKRQRPILFAAAMVRAIIEGRKTQTRRVLDPQPPPPGVVQRIAGIDYSWIAPRAPSVIWRPAGPVWAVRQAMGREPELVCRYGRPGDRLWVQEAHAFAWRVGDKVLVKYTADRAERCVALTADEEQKLDARRSPLTRQQPGRFLYRSCSRITLEVTEVRVQRLQEISEEDALVEGVERLIADGGWRNYGLTDLSYESNQYWATARESFQSLWDSINGARPGCSWSDSPWVWAITFKKAEG